MKKYVSLILAAAMALSLTACNNSSTSGSSTGSSAAEVSQPDSGAAVTSEAPADPSDGGETKLLSNPIALNSEGDIDMDVALAYQTDFDALKASFDAKEVDVNITQVSPQQVQVVGTVETTTKEQA